MSAREGLAIQINLVLIGPQHGSGSVPNQQSLDRLAEGLSLEVEGIVNLACTKTPSRLVYEQPTMAIVHFRDLYEPTPKQLTPARKDGVAPFTETELEVGTGAFETSTFRPTDMKTAKLAQYIIRRVTLGHSPVYADAASRLPAGRQE